MRQINYKGKSDRYYVSPCFVSKDGERAIRGVLEDISSPNWVGRFEMLNTEGDWCVLEQVEGYSKLTASARLNRILRPEIKALNKEYI